MRTTKDEARCVTAAGPQVQAQQFRLDSAAHTYDAQDVERRIRCLTEALAARGFCLSRRGAVLCIERWGHCRDFDDIDGAEAFAKRLGVKP